MPRFKIRLAKHQQLSGYLTTLFTDFTLLLTRQMSWIAIVIGFSLLPLTSTTNCYAIQDDVDSAFNPTIGKGVPQKVESVYRKGLAFLASKQEKDGSWPTSSGFGSETAGVSSICTMAFLSSGEDPNFGRYATQIRRGVRHVILAQNAKSGMFKGNAYDFGFSMLLLAEAYGAVDDEMLWAGYRGKKGRTVGEALELAVKAATLPKKTKQLVHKNWFSTGSSPAQGIPDTSVAGSILVGLLAARNAGISVPDHTIDTAVDYFETMTNKDGTVGYMGHAANNYGNSMARSSIATLVLAIAKRKDTKTYKQCRDLIVKRQGEDYDTHVLYGRYYIAQALFQSDYKAWQKWNLPMIDTVQSSQNDDGSIGTSPYGPNYSTGISLLSLALNFRILPIYER